LFEAGISHLALSATGEISYSVWLFP